jgi:hypothetical protein
VAVERRFNPLSGHMKAYILILLLFC